MTKLRPVEPEDLELLYTVENNPALWLKACGSGPYSRFALKQYLSSLQMAPEGSEARFVAEVTEGEGRPPRAVGLAELTDYSPLLGRAEVGILLLEKERGRGLGPEVLAELEFFAVNRLRIHLLYAYVLTDNPASEKIFLKRGFLRVARLPKWCYVGGFYRDVDLFLKFF